MDMTISVPVVLALVVGILVGLVTGYLTFPAIKEAKRLRLQVEDLLKEYESYKTSVSAHFRKTGELVGEMTRSYAAVYDHLASGARNFGVGAAETTLPFGPSPGVLASPVIETTPETDAATDVEELRQAAADTDESPLAAGNDEPPTDAAIDGSMLAAELFVGNETALDSSSETTVGRSSDARDTRRHIDEDAESRKA